MLYFYLNGASTSPFPACSVKNKGCEEDAKITKYSPFLKCLFSSDVFVAVPSFLLKLPFDRGRGSTDLASLGLYCHDRGLIFPSTARASPVSKLFIIWLSVMPVSVSTSTVSRSSGQQNSLEECSSSSSIFEMSEKIQSS